MPSAQPDSRFVVTTIIFEGHVPSKKNSKRLVGHDGNLVLLPSEAHEDWKNRELPTLDGAIVLYPPYEITAVFYSGTLRSEDMSNKIESVNDLLVDAGILEDDNWFALQGLYLKFGGLDRKKPRTELTIRSSIFPTTIAQIKEAFKPPKTPKPPKTRKSTRSKSTAKSGIIKAGKR